MKNHNRTYILLTLALLCIVFTNIIFRNNAFANIQGDWNNSVVRKALMSGVYRCYSKAVINDTVGSDLANRGFLQESGPGNIASFKSFADVNIDASDSTSFIALPSGLTLADGNVVSCKKLFSSAHYEKDKTEFTGVLKLSGKSDGLGMDVMRSSNLLYMKDPISKSKLLEGMGYSVDNKKQCFYYIYNTSSGSKRYSDNICQNGSEVSVEKTASDVTAEDGGTWPVENLTFNSKGNSIEISKAVQGSAGNLSIEVSYDDEETWDDFRDKVTRTLINGDGTSNFTTVRGDSLDQNLVREPVQNNFGNSSFSLHGYLPAASKAIEYLSNYSLEDLKFSKSEKLSYYSSAIKYWFFDGVDSSEYYYCGLTESNKKSTYSDYTPLKYDIDSNKKTDSCGIKVNASKKKNNTKGKSDSNIIYGFTSDDYFDASGDTTLTLEETIQAINDLIESMTDEELDEAGIISGTTANSDCISSGAAENLGWIICPILEFADTVSQDLYKSLIEPALRIDPKLFKSDTVENNDAYDAWTIFQGFANTIFIIFFLFVIFSQVTGVGIDNYGIKKIMPKLIITAIMVNLSYVICQVCVDLSNIIGNGIQDIFNGLSASWGQSLEIKGANITAEVGSTMITAIGIAAAAYLAYVTAPVWILPLLVAMIGALISILFLFILLAGREAIVVLLTVISPLAFVCYLLPNTKKMFDKYVKISEVMLLLYPICSLMVAGGGFVSKLMLSVGAGGDGLFNALAAMIISIVPIFFIPKVVKSSFNALGSMGASISGFGARLSGRAKSGISKSGAYKAGQERLNEAQTRWRAGIGADGKPIDMTLGQRILRGSFTERGRNKNLLQALKDQDTKNRAERLASPIGYEAAQIAQQKALEADQLKDYMTYINAQTNNGENEKALNDLFQDYTKSGQENKLGALAVARIAGRRNDTANRFLDNHFNNNANYSGQMRDALAKEIATGENSANYRASSPLGFEYASQLNNGNTSASSYSEWLGNKNNVHDALDHHVTNSRELVGLKKNSLEEMYNLAQNGQMHEDDIGRISNLARSTIENRGRTGVWDSTKEDIINKLADLRTVQTQSKQPSIIMGTEGQFQEEMRQRHNNPPKPSGQNNNNQTPGGIILS